MNRREQRTAKHDHESTMSDFDRVVVQVLLAMALLLIAAIAVVLTVLLFVVR
jgi:uncharacterized membrane protein